MTGSEMKIPTPEELEAMLARGELKLLGAGSRRECYAIPGTQLCLKCYRDESTAPNATVAREIRKYRHDEKRNTCAQEYRYWLELKSKLPAYVFAAFPESFELIHLPTRGYALLESRVENEDGTTCERFAISYRDADASLKNQLLSQFSLLISALSAYTVCFYDTQNIIVQHEQNRVRLRIVDFEPATRTLISLDRIIPRLCEMKVLRRARRYVASHLGSKLASKRLPASLRRKWDSLIANEGQSLGLSDCAAFLEDKQLNDIFYRGRFKGRPCIVKCSSRATDTLHNEATILSRLNAIEPNLFPAVLAHAEFNGFGLLVMEEIVGQSLDNRLMTFVSSAEADEYAADLKHILCILHAAGIVHRDIIMPNFLVGVDGHLRLIDFQLAIDRNAYMESRWARYDPVYLYIIFGATRHLPVGTWNDIESVLPILGALPQTEAVVAVTAALQSLKASSQFVATPGLVASLRLIVYKMSLKLQLFFARKGSEKRWRLEWRCTRFAAGRKSA